MLKWINFDKKKPNQTSVGIFLLKDKGKGNHTSSDIIINTDLLSIHLQKTNDI